MLVVFGIIILFVSFIIALISLVTEERKREKLVESFEPKEEELSNQEIIEMDDEDRKVRQEEKRKKLQETIDSYTKAEEDEHEASLKAEGKQTVLETEAVEPTKEPFPWEEDQSDDSVFLDDDQAQTVTEDVTVDANKSIPISKLGTEQKPLVGSFKLQDINKDK